MHKQIAECINEEAMAGVMHALQKHLDQHQTAGQVWPNNAECCLQYRIKAWPTGWQDCLKFFQTPKDVKAYVAQMKDWATLEDNYFEIDAYWLWDLGPVRQSLDELNAVEAAEEKPRKAFYMAKLY